MGLTDLTASSMSDAFSRAMSLSWLKPWEMRETLMALIKKKQCGGCPSLPGGQ